MKRSKVQTVLATLLILAGVFAVSLGTRSGATLPYLLASAAFLGAAANAVGAWQGWRREKEKMNAR
jgi:predicted hotdog family 3-hydroxylacyl-ACP dehydratase